MTNVSLTSEMTVKLIDSMASDIHVTRAAQVSAKGENNPETDTPRLINALMADRHGSPFEHNSMIFFVKAPIFVFREFHRHRVGFSYNEMSGRYTTLLPLFYSPDELRQLINTGTSMRPTFDGGSDEQRFLMRDTDLELCQKAWDVYEARIEAGIAKELARTVLPVSTYSQMYVTLNARSLMSFISLRTDARTHGVPDAIERGLPVSRPQREIELVAEKLEAEFAKLMPHTHASFVANGRVAP